MGVFSPKVS